MCMNVFFSFTAHHLVSFMPLRFTLSAFASPHQCAAAYDKAVLYSDPTYIKEADKETGEPRKNFAVKSLLQSCDTFVGYGWCERRGKPEPTTPMSDITIYADVDGFDMEGGVEGFPPTLKPEEMTEEDCESENIKQSVAALEKEVEEKEAEEDKEE